MATETAVQATVEQIECIREICAMGSHTFYTEEFTHRLEKAFGLPEDRLIEEIECNTGDFKGLFVADLPPNSTVKGSSSHNVMYRLAAKYNLPGSGAMGRGTAFRQCLQQVMDHLQIKDVE